MATSTTSHCFHITRIDMVAKSLGSSGGIQYFQYRNQFDELGDLVSLRRLTNENNPSFRRRIQDTMVHFANSSYRGMVHGITRELGLSLYDNFRIDAKVDSNGRFIVPDPYIKFDGAYLYLYSDYANNVLDWAIDRFEPGGNYEHVGRLIEFVNTTTNFEAHIHWDVDYYDRSMRILNQSNRGFVTFERVPASTKFQLKNEYLVAGTVFFSNRTTFKTEVLSEDLVDTAGKYYIDYRNGIVKVFTIPTISDIVRYQYVKYPFVTIASPVIIHDITNENFKVKMFRQILQDNGTYAHGAATELGVDLINELLSVVPLYWGV